MTEIHPALLSEHKGQKLCQICHTPLTVKTMQVDAKTAQALGVSPTQTYRECPNKGRHDAFSRKMRDSARLRREALRDYRLTRRFGEE